MDGRNGTLFHAALVALTLDPLRCYRLPMPLKLTDRVRVLVDSALSSPRGDRFAPVRVARQVLGTVNDVAGRPFCSEEELARRRARREAAGVAGGMAEREAAPVMVYFDGQDHRTLRKVEELLRAQGIPWKTLDVTDDEATRSWARTQAHRDEFPLVFIAGEAVGGLHELTQLDVNGALKRRVFGA